MKRRYTLAQQIIDDIDKCHARSKAFYAMADKWDREATELFQDPRGNHELAKELRIEANKKRTRAYNLVNKKAVYLGTKLSEFLTGTMAIIPDNSAQA